MSTVQEPLAGPLPQKGYPLAAKVYQQDELSPPNKDALFAGDNVALRGADKVELSPVNKVKREPRDFCVSSPVNNADHPIRSGFRTPVESAGLPMQERVVSNPPSADERGAQFAPRKVLRETSHVAQNQHLHKGHLQLTQNEDLPNFST